MEVLYSNKDLKKIIKVTACMESMDNLGVRICLGL